MSLGPRAFVAVLLFAASVWAQSPGSPEAKEKARGFFRTGTQHYDLGEFREALNDFKEAYRFYEEPIFLFNIGQCHRQIGEKEQAIRFFKVYLGKSPNAPNKVEVKDMIGKLDVALQQERAAQSGKPMGTLSPPEPKPGEVPEKPVKPEEPKPAEVKAPPPAEVKPVEVKPTEKPITVEKTPVYKKWWLWTAVGVVVVAGVGIGLGVGLSQGGTPSASTDFGTYKPF